MSAEGGLTLEELVSKWTIKTDLTPLEQGRQALKGLSLSLAALGAQVIAGAATLWEITKHTADAGDEAAKASVKFNLLATEYQALKYAARGEAAYLDMGLLFLNKSLGEAAKGGKEANKIFQDLGISLTQGGKLRGTMDILMAISKKFSEMPNDSRRTRTATEIFGRQGANLLPFLKDGPEELQKRMQEGLDFGFIIQDTEAAERFNDSLEDMENMFKGLRNTVGVQLMPVIQQILDDMKQFMIANRAAVVDDLTAFVKELAYQVKQGALFIWNMVNAVRTLLRPFGGLGNAIRIVTRSMQAFLALSTLYYLGRLGQAVSSAAKAWQAMGFSVELFGRKALIAWMKALWPAVAVGAAIAAVMLVLEDLYTFFSGSGDSLTGEIVESVGKGLKWIGEKMLEFGKFINDKVLSYVAAFADKVRNFFQPVMDVIAWIAKKTEALGNSSFMKGVQKFSNYLTGGIASAMASAPTSAMAMGLNPAMASVGDSFNRSIQSQPTINQTINVGQGADAIATGKVVGGETKNALSQTHREAARAFSAQGDY